MATAGTSHKKKVSYCLNSNFNEFYYGDDHFMEPVRISMVNELVLKYGLYKLMDVYTPTKATESDMLQFHSKEYIKFLKSISPSNMSQNETLMEKYNINADCPIFKGLYDFCQLTTGGTLAAASRLNTQDCDISVNWSGGLHHAKKAKAAGFCYVNDIVLGILELLKYHQRVMYVDIDAHHGDGVEEAFLATDRVMTVSFHMCGKQAFPGTGNIEDIGIGGGKYYAVNIPLLNGIDDNSYESIFVPVILKALEMYAPNIIVLQCGADSLTGDKLGRFNLSTRGHGKCVEFIKNRNLPLMILGGGGYVVSNVAKLWTYETAIALGIELSNKLPTNIYSNHFGPKPQLHVNSTYMTNECSKRYINTIKMQVLENLCMLPHVPSVQIQDIPQNSKREESDSDSDVEFFTGN